MGFTDVLTCWDQQLPISSLDLSKEDGLQSEQMIWFQRLKWRPNRGIQLGTPQYLCLVRQWLWVDQWVWPTGKYFGTWDLQRWDSQSLHPATGTALKTKIAELTHSVAQFSKWSKMIKIHFKSLDFNLPVASTTLSGKAHPERHHPFGRDPKISSSQ